MKGLKLRRRLRDGAIIYEGRCPKCGWWEALDDDQLAGRVSSECSNPNCDFHETLVWRKLQK